MSTKTSKRRQKRLNTNEEEVEILDKSTSPKKTEETITKPIIETIKEVDPTEDEKINESNKEKHLDEPTKEQNGHKIEENGETEQNGDHHEEKIEDTTENTLDASENISHQDSEALIVIDSDVEEDIHLILEDTEEEPREKSPVLTGMTTRSHKSSPQKVDKSENGTDTKINNEVRVNITRIEDETPVETDSTKENKTEEIEEKDTTNASIFVNLGNDTTRNIDMTTSVIEETISNSFVDVNKDIPYGQALRTLSGRRTLRRESPYVSRFGKSNLEKDTTDARKSYIPHISSVKRKATGEIPDEPKRYKTENSPGLFSYISSPITNFRNKISRSEVPSSTPKLTSYNKYAQGNNIIDDMSHIDLEEKTEPKKWCSIM